MKNHSKFYLRPAFLIILITCLCPGCATQMLHHGWAVVSRPKDLTRTRFDGTARPIEAVIDRKGNLVVEYDVLYSRYGFLAQDEKHIGIKRETNTVEVAELLPASQVDRAFDPKELLPSTGESSMLPPGTLLRHVCQWDLESYPLTECVFQTGGGLFWYVPPPKNGQEPRMALVRGEEESTAWYIWPIRVVSYPVVLVGDLIVWPLFYGALRLGLGEPP